MTYTKLYSTVEITPPMLNALETFRDTWESWLLAKAK